MVLSSLLDGRDMYETLQPIAFLLSIIFKRKRKTEKESTCIGGVAKTARRNGINDGFCAWGLCLCRSSLQAFCEWVL